MFLPGNKKKLTNVSVVSLKKFGRKYELAVYPNKLYEYRGKITSNIADIVHVDKIFASVSKGKLCPEKYLKDFNMPYEQIIKEILDKGVEQKDTKTRNFELEKTENEIICLVKSRLLNKGKFMSEDFVRKLIAGFNITVGNAKVQALEIVKILSEAGYEKIKMKIKVSDKKHIESIKKAIACVVFEESIVKIDSSDYPELRSFCEKNRIDFIIMPKEDVVEEQLC